MRFFFVSSIHFAFAGEDISSHHFASFPASHPRIPHLLAQPQQSRYLSSAPFVSIKIFSRLLVLVAREDGNAELPSQALSRVIPRAVNGSRREIKESVARLALEANYTFESGSYI